jgi:N-acetylmuramoyl-L-alanine amidase
MTGKLTVGGDGRITGPARIEYNDPWPCGATAQYPAGSGFYGSGAMMGVVEHTMVGNLPGTVAWFNNRANGASAHFSVGQDGLIHQHGPVGKGWCAWHAYQANLAWYGIEHADNGNPANPLTDAQLTASAQLVEMLSAFAGFPLQISDSPLVKGYGWHGMGGAGWGGHYDCPGDVRKAQRAEIIARAAVIRNPPPPGPPAMPGVWRHLIGCWLDGADLVHVGAGTDESLWETRLTVSADGTGTAWSDPVRIAGPLPGVWVGGYPFGVTADAAGFVFHGIGTDYVLWAVRLDGPTGAYSTPYHYAGKVATG